MRPRVIIVMGVSGSGKTTVGRALAERLGWEFIEGDALHPTANVEKMSRGEALTDGDRWPWLDRVRGEIERVRRAGGCCVAACSALRRVYRERLRRPEEDDITFVHLSGAADLIRRRMNDRAHFMKTGMLDGQLATLEAPGPDEALRVDVARPVEEIVEAIVKGLQLSGRR